MKHILLATTGIVLALAVAGTANPVKADVDAVASIDKTKDIHITETITVTKDVLINVDASFVLQGGAEAHALLNVTNSHNDVDGQDIPDLSTDPANLNDEYGIHLTARVTDAVNSNQGVFGFNQDVGNMSNQANVVSVAGISDVDAFADAQAHADQVNTDNSAREHEVARTTAANNPIADLGGSVVNPATLLPNKSAQILRSINGNTGVIGVNQNAGNMNNQHNALAAAVGIGAELAMAEGDLGQVNSNNHVDEVETVKLDSISGSINGNIGVINVNQSTGNMNNQANVVSVSAILSGTSIVSTP